LTSIHDANYSASMKPTITNIAKQAGISQGFLSNILCGRARPHYRTAKKLGTVTGTDPVLWIEGSVDEMRQSIFKYQEKAA